MVQKVKYCNWSTASVFCALKKFRAFQMSEITLPAFNMKLMFLKLIIFNIVTRWLDVIPCVHLWDRMNTIHNLSRRLFVTYMPGTKKQNRKMLFFILEWFTFSSHTAAISKKHKHFYFYQPLNKASSFPTQSKVIKSCLESQTKWNS